MEDFVENDHVKLWIEEDILHGFYKKDCIIGLEAAKEIVKLRLKLQNGRIYKGVAYITHIKVVTPDARKYFAIQGYTGLEKIALISNSKISILLGNLFILINKPPMPTRLFNNLNDALKWLRE